MKERDYAIKLIAGIRKRAEKDYVKVSGGIGIPSNWIDALILCDVVERELTDNDKRLEHTEK